MAYHEREAQHVIADFVVNFFIVVRLRIEIAQQFFVFAFERFLPPDCVDGATLGCRHKPGAGIVREALPRPLRERRDESILREIFGPSDVANDPRQRRDELRGFDAPDRIECFGIRMNTR
jgi:hypothetical protein